MEKTTESSTPDTLVKTIYKCEKCNGINVESKAWVSLNNTEIIDWSLSENGDIEDFYCEDCEEHTKIKITEKPVYEEDTVGEIIYQGLEMSVRITELRLGHTILFSLYSKNGKEVYTKYVCDLEAYK